MQHPGWIGGHLGMDYPVFYICGRRPMAPEEFGVWPIIAGAAIWLGLDDRVLLIISLLIVTSSFSKPYAR